MNGDDREDQLRQYYHVQYKSHEYYKYIFWFLSDTSITNALILFNSYRQKIDLKTFRVELAKALLGNYSNRKKRSTNGPSPSQQLTVRHYPIKRRTESKKGLVDAIIVPSIVPHYHVRKHSGTVSSVKSIFAIMELTKIAF